MSEFWAAIAGAIVGGAISFITQLIAIREARDLRAEEQKLQTEALANALCYKVIRIVSNLSGLHGHFVDDFELAQRNGFNGESWQIVVPLANTPDFVHFSADEMSMLLRQRDDAVFNSILDLDARHNALIGAALTFNGLRKTLTDRISAAGIIVHEQGQALQHNVEPNAVNELRPLMVEVNHVVSGLAAALKVACPEAKGHLLSLHKVLREKCGLTHNLQFKDASAT